MLKMFAERKLIKEIQDKFPNSNLISLVDSQGSIAYPMIDSFAEQLRVISSYYDKGQIPKILLLIDTDGGNLSAARAIAKLVRQYTKNYEAVVVGRAMSSGTLLALAADKIWMTPRACLGPIDPTITNFSSHTPQIPLSVQDLELFFSNVHASKSVKVEALTKIIRAYDPIVLGQALRARKQIRETAQEFLENKIQEPQLSKTLDLLTGGWGTHGNPITREDAKNLFHLPIAYVEESADNVLTKLLNLYRVKLRAPDNQYVIEKMKGVKKGDCKDISTRLALLASGKAGTNSLVWMSKFQKTGDADNEIQCIAHVRVTWEPLKRSRISFLN